LGVLARERLNGCVPRVGADEFCPSDFKSFLDSELFARDEAHATFAVWHSVRPREFSDFTPFEYECYLLWFYDDELLSVFDNGTAFLKNQFYITATKKTLSGLFLEITFCFSPACAGR
jgi:hypothetical protein